MVGTERGSGAAQGQGQGQGQAGQGLFCQILSFSFFFSFFLLGLAFLSFSLLALPLSFVLTLEEVNIGMTREPLTPKVFFDNFFFNYPKSRALRISPILAR